MKLQVTDISHNMAILMATLQSKFGPFREFGGSNSEATLDGKSRDNKNLEREMKKESEKERPSSSNNTSSQSLFKVEVKVGIKPYQGDIDAIKFNQWLE